MNWLKRYQLHIPKRSALLQKLSKLDKPSFNTRPKPHSWAVDEILRHQIGSEVRYIHQVLDESLPQSEYIVPAQWVGNILFRLEEKEHVPLPLLVAEFERIQSISEALLGKVDEATESLLVKAPWGSEVPAQTLLHHFFEHDLQHLGQVQYLFTYFAGPPEFVLPDKSVKYG